MRGTAYLDLLTATTAREADALVTTLAAGVPADLPHRETMRAVKVLVLADVTTGPDPDRASVIGALLDHLEAQQGPTGLFDGDNLVSPPDSSFTLNDVCLTLEVLARAGESAGPAGVADRLRALAARSVDALVTGGVHTPNHRWELCSALAGLHHVLGDPRLVPRIDEWLSEGIDIDADGFYSERSPNYAAYVTNPALLTIARLLDRPALRDVVRAQLRTLPSLVDDDGEVVTVQSRRQDQRETFGVHAFLSQLRWFAVHDGDASLARLVALGLAAGPPDASRHLAEALVDPVLVGDLPEAAPAPEGTTAWPTVGLVRHRSGTTTTTVFGGSDHRATGRIASGLANSATVLQVRHGDARLRALRISPEFFDTGAFRPDRMDVDGTHVTLVEERVSGYYQPLPAPLRRADGDYPLTDEGRFFAQMDFPFRPRSELRLTTRADVRPTDHGVTVDLTFAGVSTAVGLELVLGDGDLDGVEPHPRLTDVGWLRGDELVLRTGADELRVRVSGHLADVPPRFDDGELFTYVHGEDRVPGRRVLVAARTDRPLHVEVVTGRHAAGPVR
ncbi:hypothetical protein [Cellulomonas soli]|uniref:Heparinase II/III-like protein n=1 Tax=Cellulomonas soli TaxID=931535 RepID=A0A512PF86_9CELL|nr:hypothetical protein [Cellulomonas soli]NYI59345.1 hypothetical protein [Cellulomonas soli]GEP69867.1 hypothetical protein CSO01_25820 [Cellulomonas soli]